MIGVLSIYSLHPVNRKPAWSSTLTCAFCVSAGSGGSRGMRASEVGQAQMGLSNFIPLEFSTAIAIWAVGAVSSHLLRFPSPPVFPGRLLVAAGVRWRGATRAISRACIGCSASGTPISYQEES